MERNRVIDGQIDAFKIAVNPLFRYMYFSEGRYLWFTSQQPVGRHLPGINSGGEKMSRKQVHSDMGKIKFLG
jgi:hypothetical protein